MTQSSPQPIEKLSAISWILLTVAGGAMFIYNLKDTYAIIVSNDADKVTTVQNISGWIGWAGWATLISAIALYAAKDSIMRERLGVYTLLSIFSVGWIIQVSAHLPHVTVILIVAEIIAIILAISAIIVWHHTTKYETQGTQETDET